MNYRALAVHSTRAVYAISWYNISPALIYIESDLFLNQAQVGLLVTAFYIGAGVSQIPAGYLATIIGNRNMASSGIFLLGISGLLSFISPGLTLLIVSRAMAGIASGMFFSPAMGTLRNITDDRTFGFHVNVFNGVFSLGAGAGLAGWAILDIVIGWRIAFLVSGLITISFSLIYYFSLRGVHEEKPARSPSNIMKSVLTNRVVWILGMAGSAAIISENVAAAFIVYYLEKALGILPSPAALAGTLILAFGFAGGIVGGLVAGRYISTRLFFYLTTVAVSILMISIAFIRNIVEIYVIVSLIGMLTAPIISSSYVLITGSLRGREEITSSMSVVNGIQQIPGSVWPYAFTLVVSFFSFGAAWMFIGVSSLALLTLGFLPSVRKMSLNEQV